MCLCIQFHGTGDVFKTPFLTAIGKTKEEKKRKWDKGSRKEKKKKKKDQREKLLMGNKHMTPFLCVASCTVNTGLLCSE